MGIKTNAELLRLFLVVRDHYLIKSKLVSFLDTFIIYLHKTFYWLIRINETE